MVIFGMRQNIPLSREHVQLELTEPNILHKVIMIYNVLTSLRKSYMGPLGAISNSHVWSRYMLQGLLLGLV